MAGAGVEEHKHLPLYCKLPWLWHQNQHREEGFLKTGMEEVVEPCKVLVVHSGMHCILCMADQRQVDQRGRDSTLLGVEHKVAVEVGHRAVVGVGLGRTVL